MNNRDLGSPFQRCKSWEYLAPSPHRVREAVQFCEREMAELGQPPPNKWLLTILYLPGHGGRARLHALKFWSKV